MSQCSPETLGQTGQPCEVGGNKEEQQDPKPRGSPCSPGPAQGQTQPWCSEQGTGHGAEPWDPHCSQGIPALFCHFL